MSIFDFIGDIFSPATKLIDDLHTSDEEKLKLRNELSKIKMKMHEKSVSLMTAEANSDHWIVAAVRPICTLILFTLILLGAFGWIKTPTEVYHLAEIYMGVYAGGRSAEKIGRILKK